MTEGKKCAIVLDREDWKPLWRPVLLFYMALKNPELSYFATGPEAEVILTTIKDNLGKISKAKIYEKLLKIDPDIPGINTFYDFCKGIDEERKKRAVAVLETMKSVEGLNERDLIDAALGGVAGLGNVVIRDTLEEAKELLAKGETLPPEMKKTVMEWFFKGTDARAKADNVKIKTRQAEMLESVVDNLMTAARYQKLKDKNEVIEGEFEEKEIEAELKEETENIYAR